MRRFSIIRKLFAFVLLPSICLQAIPVSSQPTDTLYYQRLLPVIAPEQLPVHEGLYDSVYVKIQLHHNRNRERLTAFYGFSPYVAEQLKAAGLPDLFKYIPLIVSDMNCKYQGNYQKSGLWGIDRITGHRYGLRMDSLTDERFDPEKSTAVAVKELQRLMSLYEGNVWETILAYYSSPANVNEGKIRQGLDNPSPWDLIAEHQLFPTDPLTSLLSWIYACHFGSLSAKQLKGERLETCRICCKQPVFAGDVCSLLQLEDSLFKRCNPAILGQRIPANSTLHLPLEKELLFYHYEEELYLKYNEHITRDSIARVQEDSIRQIQTAEKANKTANGTANSKGSTITYVVKKGDVLGKIAGKYHVSVADIKRWNNLKSDLIQIGQKLTIKQ